MYAFTVILWHTVFLEAWKRKEISCAFLWGTIGYEKDEHDRPNFEGVQRENPVSESSVEMG